MASTDALPLPIKNTAYRVTFPILDADGDLVTGATALDSEVSKDGGAFADCTNEATEIATSSGMYYLDLTNTEMNADTVSVIVKTSSSGAKTTPIVMYPQEDGDINVDVTTIAGAAVSTSSAQIGVNVVNAGGTAWASGSLTSGVFATGAITATAIAADAIGASELAADAVAEIADQVWDEARAGHVAAGSFGEGVTSVQGNVTGSVGSVTGAVGSVTGNVGGNVGGNVTGSIGSLAAQAKTDVNAEVVDALATDTYAEAGAVPAATSSLKDKINWLFALSRNKMTQTATTSTLRNDADSGNIATSTVSDDATTFTRGEWT